MGKIVSEWAETHGVVANGINNSKEIGSKEDLEIEGALLFHKNYNFEKEDVELFNTIEKRNLATHRIDLNGTAIATLANVSRWVENNRPKSILILGDKDSANDESLSRYFEKLI